MAKKIFGFFICFILFATLLPMMNACQSQTEHIGKTIFVGRFTHPSLKNNLLKNCVIGWMINDGGIHHYKGLFPTTERCQGVIGKIFFIIIYQNNPSQ